MRRRPGTGRSASGQYTALTAYLSSDARERGRGLDARQRTMRLAQARKMGDGKETAPEAGAGCKLTDSAKGKRPSLAAPKAYPRAGALRLPYVDRDATADFHLGV